MATIDLGKIKFNWRGTYAGGTAYVPDDVVYYMDGSVGSSYMCVANTTGNAPSSGGTLHASWQYLAKGQATSPTTTQGDVIVRGASADGRLAIGSAGQVLKVNSGANGLEYGTGFAGTHYVAYQHELHHGTSVTVNGSGLSNGTADGQRDCILINNGLYFTVTPGNSDDRIVINVTTNVYSNWGAGGTYWGFGFMSATSTNFASNRNVFYLSGQHSWGNGGAGGDQYINCAVTQQFDVSDIGLNAGTTYYIRPIAQVHSPNNNVQYVQNNGTNQRSKFNSWLIHYKKNV
tara:strand:+ start:47 stop:913 length:867 start_codon:yes stop_codon:yes gene_type:complete